MDGSPARGTSRWGASGTCSGVCRRCPGPARVRPLRQPFLHDRSARTMHSATTVCEDGTPALWLGTATSTPGGGYVDIAATLCVAAGVLQGSYACTAGSLQCAESSGKITGTVVGSKIYPVVSFADGSFCNFGGALVGPRGNGLYACHEPSGVLTLDYGTWALTRCP